MICVNKMFCYQCNDLHAFLYFWNILNMLILEVWFGIKMYGFTQFSEKFIKWICDQCFNIWDNSFIKSKVFTFLAWKAWKHEIYKTKGKRQEHNNKAIQTDIKREMDENWGMNWVIINTF